MNLTTQQQHVLDYLTVYIREKRYSPSHEDIRNRFGWQSKTAVVGHLKALRKKGCVDWIDGDTRTITLTNTNQTKTP